MQSSILDGLTLVDTTGKLILGATLVTLLLAVFAHLVLRMRYRKLEDEIDAGGDAASRLMSPVFRRAARDVEEAAGRSRDPDVQAIVEDAFQAELRPLLLMERFVRSATGLVLVLGLLGTFYGLTLAIGRLAHMVSSDAGPAQDVAQAVTHGLTQALSGMAVAFSNSLLGVGSAVVLTALGIASNPTDRRTGLMIRLETYLHRLIPPSVARDRTGGAADSFAESVARLDGVVARFEAALQRFTASTKDLREVKLTVSLDSRDER